MSDSEYLIKIAILETQAKEYERRLSELNHAHDQQLARNAEYVSRETWEIQTSELEKWRREIDRWRWMSISAGLIGATIISIILKLILR